MIHQKYGHADMVTIADDLIPGVALGVLLPVLRVHRHGRMGQRHRSMRHAVHCIFVEHLGRGAIHFHVAQVRTAKLLALIGLDAGARHVGIGSEVAVRCSAHTVEDEGVEHRYPPNPHRD